MQIIMLGAPGAGKGTQAKRLAERFHIPHISTGDIFRKNIQEETDLGLRVKAYIHAGELVPDSLTVDLIRNRLQEDDCVNGYILDGFPRTTAQAEAFDYLVRESGREIDMAIDLEVPNEVIIERNGARRLCTKCGASFNLIYHKPKEENKCDLCGAPLYMRDDDAPETVLTRLSVYHKQTEPLIRFYKDKGILKSIDGNGSVTDVLERILTIL